LLVPFLLQNSPHSTFMSFVSPKIYILHMRENMQYLSF
jgi:hypothetical protein